jgi:hypothetical protein
VWVESSANTYDVFAGVAIIYLTLTSLAGLGGKLVERKLAFAQRRNLRHCCMATGTCSVAPV